MSYSIYFEGGFKINPSLNKDQIKQVNEFSEVRHRDSPVTTMEYPSVWCDWVVNDSGDLLHWNREEKTSCRAKEWIEYLVKHFFEKWNVAINGKVYWAGEEHFDVGTIIVIDNKVFDYPNKLINFNK